jgi:beta-phosphoglucomutase-like phosphatase (HAD superfamily)
MEPERLDLDMLIGHWREAFVAAQEALRAVAHDVPPAELREREARLADERATTVRLLEAIARDERAKPSLVRLVTSPWETKKLLGLPADVAGCVFSVDGVLVGSAAIHAEAWRLTFDRFISKRIERTGGSFAPFDVRIDYPTRIHGKPRLVAVREFLASRGISLPEGAPTDSPDAETVHGLANAKRLVLLDELEEHTVSAFSGARLFLELTHDAGLPCAVVSGSSTTETLLDHARLTSFIDDRVDGATMTLEGLQRKPAPDMLLAACRHLGIAPGHTAVFETTRDGVRAGRVGGFELVVAIDQAGEARALRAAGADLVVADLGEILEHALAA